MKKLTKTQVVSMIKKLNEGESLKVSLFPSKCSFSGYKAWVQPYEIELNKSALAIKYPDSEDLNDLTNLDSIINDFSYYNCNSELGNRVHYYIEG